MIGVETAQNLEAKLISIRFIMLIDMKTVVTFRQIWRSQEV